jgi:hypothetical protein
MAGPWGKCGDQPTILPGALYEARHDPLRELTQLRRPTPATGVRMKRFWDEPMAPTEALDQRHRVGASLNQAYLFSAFSSMERIHQ